MILNRNNKGQIKSKYIDEDFIPLCEEYKINKNAKEFLYKDANFYLTRKYDKLI